MANAHHDSVTPLTAVTALAGVLFGVIIGYMLGVSQGGAGSAAMAPVTSTTAAAASTPVPIVNEQELQGYRNVLAADPGNVRANVELANRLYDAGRYGESVPYYQRAYSSDAKNVGVSTDLATALHYAGRSDEALAQLERSLAIDPRHGQTLFNLGVVKRDGKQDAKGAIAAWERLLAAVPDYQDAAKVRTMIADLRAKTS